MPSSLMGQVGCIAVVLTLALVLTSGLPSKTKWTSGNPKPGIISTDKRLVFVDSDGGADDLVSVIQLVQDPNTEILGIACVYGNVKLTQACSNILRTLNLLNRNDIPVYPGCDSPMTTTAVFDGFFGPDGMGNASGLYPLPTNTSTQTKHAVSAMIDTVNEHIGKVTLLSLGPLTNVAVVLKLDPFFAFKLKDHVVMGGTMQAMGNIQAVAEFNIFDDVEAAVTVFRMAAFPIRVVPYELCLSTGPTWNQYNDWVSTNTTAAIFLERVFEIANANTHMANGTRFVACDLLTTTILLSGSEVVRASTLRTAMVEQCGMVTRGQLVVDYRTTSTPQLATVNLVTDVDAVALFDIWKNILKD